jgi:hypothetical protein
MTNDRGSINIDIDLSIYESQLRGEIASDLATLQIVFEAITNPNYIQSKYVLRQKITIAEIALPPTEFLERREINKCFKSIIGSLQDYMDRLISILRLKSELITLPAITTKEQLNDFLTKKIETHILEVSTDRSLNVPKKLNILLNKPEHQVYKEAIQSYFDLRNGLEHHKGVAKTDRIIRYKRLGLASTAGYEVEKPGPLGVGEGLVLKTFDEEINYDKGGFMLIRKEQLESIILNLLIFAIPAIQTATGEKFNAKTAID